MDLTDISSQDLDAVLALNNSAGPGIVPIDGARLRQLDRQAAYFKVAKVDGRIAGFLIAFTPDSDYDSPNYRWFADKLGRFVYIDRVVVAAPFRRHGVARVMYADVLSFAELRQPWLATEVFSEPKDEVSSLFFSIQSFHEEGQLVLPGNRRVTLLAKRMKAYQYVHDHYLSLPHNPAPPEWFADRQHPLPLRMSA